ncbi:MAG: S1 RNA-binding domain-containing protein [Nitrososphaeria archaeon]|nr:S1 RNA-binding domain-containing protein [Conexivisphaerales archaeon]
MSVQEFPEVGEIVLVTVESVSPSGAWVTLDEYNNLRAFLPESEISKSTIKNLERAIKPKQKLVAKVIKADKQKLDIDVSMKQVTQEEQKLKRIEIKKSKWAESVFNIVAKKLNRQNAEKETKLVSQKYESLYAGLEELVKEGPDSFVKLGIDEGFAKELYKLASEKVKPPVVSITKMLEIYSPEPDGIEVIKKALIDSINEMKNGKAEITYISAPKYRLTYYSENYKEAEKGVKKLASLIAKKLEGKGSFRLIE